MTNNKQLDLNNISYVSKDIFNNNGALLIAKGTPINEQVIRFCERRKIPLVTCYKNPNIITKKENISNQKLITERYVKFNFTEQRYARYAPEIVSDVLEEVGNKTIACIDLITLYKKINSVYTHSIDVALLSAIFAYKLNLNKINSKKLVLASLLHDIGKCIIPSAIVNKTEELEWEEKSIMMRHAEFGSELLADLGVDEEISLIVGQHHELINGEGYPKGISRGIHIYAQIIGVTNTLNSMISDTYYKSSCTIVDALDKMEQKKGNEFDYSLIDILFQIFERKIKR